MEYLKAACPTCDHVRCPEGQECKMVEDLPQCAVRIPGGCEVDKCGEGRFIISNILNSVKPLVND